MSEPDAHPQPAPVDLSDLRLMPDWVASFGKPTAQKQFRDRDDERPDRGGKKRGDRAEGGRRDERGGRFGGGAPGNRPRPGGGKFGGKGERRGSKHPHGGERADFPPREPLPADIAVGIEVEEKAADALAAHIRATGRAFSMFDASRLVLESGDRFHARLTCAPERATGLFQVAADGAVFLTREEAAAHVLQSADLLAQYYRTEEVELEEPKGEFKSIGVCGMSGTLIGPPSHHSYQTAIIRLHRERFANLTLEDYKRRIRVESDPELVTKWKEQQRKGTRWVHLKSTPAEGQEPQAFATRAEMEAHFRLNHAAEVVQELREALAPGTGPRENLSRPLIVLLQRAVEHARKNLFEFSQRLGHALEHRGLKLFRRRSGKLFISRIRPRAIDPGVVFSERVTKIVETIKAQPGILIPKLVEAAMSPLPEDKAADPAALHEAQLAVVKDLRWLADEGYVIEYSDDAVFLGIQGEPQPAKPATTPAAPAPTATASEAAPPPEPPAETVVEATADAAASA